MVPEPALGPSLSSSIFFYTFVTNSALSVALLLCRLSLSRRALALARFLVGRLRRHLHRRTQNNLRAGAKAACLGSGSGTSLCGGPRVSGCKGDHQGSYHVCKSPTAKPGTHLGGCRLILLTTTVPAPDWLPTETIVQARAKADPRVINARPSPQSDTKSRRAEANQGNDPVQDLFRGAPLSDRATTGRV
jgi:hypothetical protein